MSDARDDELRQLRTALEEAEQTLSAIRNGEVDALVVSGPQGGRVFTFQGADAIYRVLVEEMNEGTVILSPRGIVLYCNRRFAELIGATMGRVVGSEFGRWVNDGSREPFARLTAAAGSRAIGEVLLRAEGGPAIPVRVSLTGLPMMTGAVSLIVTDLTQSRLQEESLQRARAQLEQQVAELARVNDDLMHSRAAVLNMMEDSVEAGVALRRANEELRRYLDLVEVIVVAVNADGAIQIVNRKGCEILGYREAELLGKDWFDLCVPQRLVDERRAFFRTFIADPPHEPAYLEYPVRTRSGVERTIAWRWVPLADEAGRAIGLLRSGEDVTDRRSLEAQFRQAQKMEAIGRLAGGVAHDFNNVLTAILGYCDLLKDDLRENPSALEDVEEIRRAGERAARLTQQLLAFSRKQMAVPQVLDLNTVLQSTQKMLSRLIGDDVRLAIAPAARLGRVNVDPGLVEQILLNLAVNARDAMPAGGELTIATSNTTLDAQFAKRHVGSVAGDYVALMVRDTGVGMSPDILEHVFEPFFTTKGQGKGTGLGLSTVYGIVKQSRGYITVESAPDQGTTFTIYLPRVTGRKAAPAVRLAAPTALTGGETILVVEDEPFVGAIIQKVLAPRGFRLLYARGAAEALAIEAAHDGPIHLLISDVVMSDVSGPELAARLSVRRPAMKVLFISGFIDHEAIDLEALSRDGAFLQKPFTPDALAAKVRQQLDAPPPTKPVHQSSSEPTNP